MYFFLPFAAFPINRDYLPAWNVSFGGGVVYKIGLLFTVDFIAICSKGEETCDH